MKIGIIGYGFVGQALEAGFIDKVNILKIDPKLKTKTDDLKDFNPDVIFVCVPTPMNEDGSQDISILRIVLDEIKKLRIQSLVVLKSTVLPHYIDEIENLIPNFVYNPEFLREKHAKEDFINSKLIVFGGCKTSSEVLARIYKDYTKCLSTNYIYTDAISASFIKYTINSFLATKVTFFNELYSLFQASGTKETWGNFIFALSKDERLGSSHMDVPGHDGRFGFGGACLPKDSSAFALYSELEDKPLNVLKKAIKTNNKIRAKYNNQTKREIEQNISFNNLNK